ncbi:MAG TPA: phosphatase PAP2 family protein [Edaphocola sp.]|nr:phosphatase PAP2 family protein [Edaphocola sp.]
MKKVKSSCILVILLNGLGAFNAGAQGYIKDTTTFEYSPVKQIILRDTFSEKDYRWKMELSGAPDQQFLKADQRRLLAAPSILPPANNAGSPALSVPAVIIPAIGVGYGVAALHKGELRTLNISTRNEVLEDHSYFHTHTDDYLQWSPAAAVMGLNLMGVHGARPFKEELCIYALSTAIMGGTVYGLKHFTKEERPDYSSFTSFPSGHTATAFAAAEWLRAEYWQRSPWVGVAGYAAATATGILRLYNNRHWVSDVIAGAAVGFLSTRIAYLVNPWIANHLFYRKRQVSSF